MLVLGWGTTGESVVTMAFLFSGRVGTAAHAGGLAGGGEVWAAGGEPAQRASEQASKRASEQASKRAIAGAIAGA